MTQFIRLPQLKIFAPSTEKNLMFISGGRPPTLEWLLDCSKDIDRIWCIDHGIDTCRQAELIPELLIGDLDSARSDSVEWAQQNNVAIERYPVDKDFTDTQLALDRAAKLDESPYIIMTGAFGGRVDHLYATLFSCAQSPLKIFLADQREVIAFVRDGESIRLQFDIKPLALSLLPFSNVCKGVSVDGVHWALDRAELYQTLPNAVSNRVENDIVNVSIERGMLAIALTFD